MDRKDAYEREMSSLRRYAPSDGNDLSGMEEDFVAYLAGLDELDASTVTVRRTNDPRELIVAEALAAPDVTLEDATEAVRQVWLGQLGCAYSEAHYAEVLDGRAVLHCVTQIGPGGFYVTGTVTITANDR